MNRHSPEGMLVRIEYRIKSLHQIMDRDGDNYYDEIDFLVAVADVIKQLKSELDSLKKEDDDAKP